MMNLDELPPCPCCQSADTKLWIVGSIPTRYRVRCMNESCQVYGPLMLTQEAAVYFWRSLATAARLGRSLETIETHLNSHMGRSLLAWHIPFWESDTMTRWELEVSLSNGKRVRGLSLVDSLVALGVAVEGGERK